MKVDGTKIADAIKAEIGEMIYGVHDGIAFSVGKVQVRKGVWAQVQIKISIANDERLKDPELALLCVED